MNVLILGAKQRRQIPHRAKVGLNRVMLALHGGLLDLQVGKGRRLNSKFVGSCCAWPAVVRHPRKEL